MTKPLLKGLCSSQPPHWRICASLLCKHGVYILHGSSFCDSSLYCRNPSAFQSSLKESSYFWVTGGLDSSGKQNRCDGSVYWTAAIIKHHSFPCNLARPCSVRSRDPTEMLWRYFPAFGLWEQDMMSSVAKGLKKKREREREPVKLIIYVMENA